MVKIVNRSQLSDHHNTEFSDAQVEQFTSKKV